MSKQAIQKTINTEKQNRHIEGKKGSKGRSLLDIDAQELLDLYFNNGDIKYSNEGRITKECFTHSSIIGRWLRPGTLEYTQTNRGTIHYSNTGAHIVPSQPKNYQEGK